jgi:cation transport regulator ChaB
MPYKTNEDLPESVKNVLPVNAQDIFRNVANSVLNDNGTDESAMKQAWGAVKRTYEQNKKGEWVKKIEKAMYQGKEVELDKPFRTPDESKKFAVYVKDGDTVKIVRFGDQDMEIKRDDPEARASFRARHKCDEKKDKTTAGFWACRMWDDETVSELLKEECEKMDLNKRVEIKKVNEKKIIYAWAYVCESDGKQVVDHSGDIIDEADMEKMAYDFMEEYRDGGEMHEKTGVAKAVASMPFTRELQNALNIDVGKVGWLIVFKITDDEVWGKIKDGTYKMMSIGGQAKRNKIENYF